MTCPNCGRALAAATHEGIVVDESPGCGGTWFDADELRRAKDSSHEDLRWLDFDVFADSDSFTAASGQRACPKCGDPMGSLTYMDSDVVIDACPWARATGSTRASSTTSSRTSTP